MINQKLKKTMALTLTLGMLVSATACSTGNNETPAADSEKTITILESRGLTPESAEASKASAAFSLYEAIYEPLVKYGQNGEIEPSLAEKWTISEDGKTYTFFLRKDVKFSDGEEFNADSVILASQKWDPKSFSSEMKNVEKIDDYTVAISFATKSYPCLTEFTYPRPYRIPSPKSYDEQTGEFKGMIGTGQWMIESYETGNQVVLVPNPYYYGEKPKVEKLILKEVSEGQSRFMALQNGEADISLASIPVENYDLIKQDENLDILEKDGTMGFYLIMNYENSLLQDENVRKALNYGVNKESITKDLLDGEGTPAKGLLPQTVPYVNENNSKGYAFDEKKAKELLANSGYSQENPVKLRLAFQTEEYASWKPLCEYLQATYAKIGINIELVQLESSAYYDAIWDNRDFDLIIYRTYEDSWNPHGFLRSLFYQAEGAKSVNWYDEKLNKDLDEVITIMDEQQRQVKYDEILGYIENNALTVPLYYPKLQYVYNKRLQNIVAAPTSYEAIEWHLVEKN